MCCTSVSVQEAWTKQIKFVPKLSTTVKNSETVYPGPLGSELSGMKMPGKRIFIHPCPASQRWKLPHLSDDSLFPQFVKLMWKYVFT